MKRKHALSEESESIDMVVASDDHATKEIMLDARFTSFLEKDNYFLTPWSWDPNASMNDTNSNKEKEYVSFHPESYFTYEVIFSLFIIIPKSLNVQLCSRFLVPTFKI